MSIQQKHVLELVILLAGACLLLFSGGSGTLFLVGILLVGLSVVLQLLLNRCPSCHRFITDDTYRYGKRCPRCGRELK